MAVPLDFYAWLQFFLIWPHCVSYNKFGLAQQNFLRHYLHSNIVYTMFFACSFDVNCERNGNLTHALTSIEIFWSFYVIISSFKNNSRNCASSNHKSVSGQVIVLFIKKDKKLKSAHKVTIVI